MTHTQFATQADVAYLTAHDHHVTPATIMQKIARGEILMRYDDADARPIAWLRFGYFWDELPFMNLVYIEDAFRRQGLGTGLIGFWEDAMRRQNHTCVLTSSLANEQGGAFAKAMSGKKDDIVKALLNVTAFPYEGKVPRSMRFTVA